MTTTTTDAITTARFRPSAIAVALLSLVAAGCSRGVAATHKREAAALPLNVSVALPLATPIADYSEYTGRAESPSTVEVRARVAGHLSRAAFREGERVKRGALLFVVDSRPFEIALTRARAELASVRADLALARKNAGRAAQLVKSQAIAERDYDLEVTAVELLVAREAAAASAVASAQLDLEYAHVKSPIDGRVSRKLVTEGNYVSPASPTPLTTIVSTDPLYVFVDVDEAHARQLTLGAKLRAKVGFVGEEGHPHDVDIDFVDNRVDPTTGTLRIRAVVHNRDGRLTPGLFARVRLLEGTPRNALLISDRAIGTDQDRRYVWVVGTDDKVARKVVELGAIENGLRVVRAGLAATDRVVVRGLQRVGAGVRVAPTMVSMATVNDSTSAQVSR